MSDLTPRRRRYDPLSTFDDMRKAFKSFFSDVPEWFDETPIVDVKREDNEYIIEAELPGRNQDDIDVNVEGDVLTLSSKKEEKREEGTEEEGYLVKERRSSSFRRSFTLPSDADVENIDASFKNGLLTLHIPRTEEKKPKKIQIKSS